MDEDFTFSGNEIGENILKVPDGTIIDFAAVSTSQKVYAWKLKEDITAYELAIALSVLLAAANNYTGGFEEMINDLPESARRHFEEA